MLIPGYNGDWAEKANYHDFEAKFTEGLTDLKIDGLSLMLYGSYLRPDDFNAGISDIDAVLIFPDDVMIDKNNLQKVSIVLANSLKGNDGVAFQVAVCDLTTSHDGRFNSYGPSFEGHFRRDGKIIYGPDYRDEMRFILPSIDEQNSVATNLRKTWLGLLFAQHHLQSGEPARERFISDFNNSLQAISRSSKQVVYFLTHNIHLYRFGATDDLAYYFPDINLCMDNAAMVAALGGYLYKKGQRSNLYLNMN